MTGKSETKDKAFKRYAMTGNFIQRLHEEKPWNKKSAVQNINRYHSNAASFLSKLSKMEMKIKSEAILDKQVQELEPLDHILLENLEEIRNTHFFNVKFSMHERYLNDPMIFSQFSMAMVQSAFIGSIVTYPEMFGVLDVSK